MPKKKQFDMKVNVSLPKELAEWLEDQVEAGVFSSISHGIRRCVATVKQLEEKGESTK